MGSIINYEDDARIFGDIDVNTKLHEHNSMFERACPLDSMSIGNPIPEWETTSSMDAAMGMTRWNTIFDGTMAAFSVMHDLTIRVKCVLDPLSL